MERINKDLPILIAQSGPLNGQRWVIKGSMVIGRDKDCDIIIPDRQVSRFHARCTSTNKGVLLEDLGSKNGTYFNHLQIEEPIVLQDGSSIAISLIQEFVYLSSDATMPMDSISSDFFNKTHKIKIDEKSRRVWVNGIEIIPSLSAPQYKLLEILLDQKERVVSRQEIISAVWGDKEAIGVTDQALDALVRRLRDRLKEIDNKHEYIITIRGHGLRLDNPLL